ncbi:MULTISPECIES: hypothetical protein [unclassified Mesorhizobium]|uniref:hypothetical protein n=1 Tax=unclassified Mesorhizobium TaxID=325217 RepID=UPI0030155B13
MKAAKERLMGEGTKAKSPVNFEFVEGHGIHPFYLDMALDQLVEAAIGWKVALSERDASLDTLEIRFEIDGKYIDVGVINTLFSVPGSKKPFQGISHFNL